MLIRIYAIEHAKIWRQRMVGVLAAIAGLIAAGVVAALAVVSQMEMAAQEAGSQVSGQALVMSTWPGAPVNSLNVVSGAGIGSLLVIILAGAAVTQEYQWRTLHLWLSRGVPRPVYALARFASLLPPVLLLAAAALVAGGAAGLAVTFLSQGPGALPGLPPGTLALGLLRAAYTLLPYAALAFLLGILTRSAAATIGAGLAFSLLLENVAGQVLGFLGGGAAQMARFLPQALAAGVLTLNQAAVDGLADSARGTPHLLDPFPAAVGIALYTLLLLALAAWSLQRQDLAG